MCQIFREEFGKVYKRYVKPKKTQEGFYDKVNIIDIFKKKTQEL